MINKNNVVPKNFDINQYQGMDRLSALDWLFQLESRYQLHTAIDSFHLFVNSSDEINEEEQLQFLNQIIEDYFNEPFKVDRLYSFFSKQLNENAVITIYYKYEQLPAAIIDGNVKIMTSEDFYQNHQLYKHLYNIDNESFISKVIEYEDSLDSIKRTPILIDLTQPNKVLEKEFKNILMKLRDQISTVNPVKGLTNYKLITWASYQLLAYIDLYLWSMINKKTIKPAVISRALYQNQSDYGEDTLRKSVKPILDRLFYSHGIHDNTLIYPTQLFDELKALAIENSEIF